MVETNNTQTVVVDMHIHSEASIVTPKLLDESGLDQEVSIQTAVGEIERRGLKFFVNCMIRVFGEERFNGYKPVDSLQSSLLLVASLKLRGVDVFALTDHDSTEGLKKASLIARIFGMVMIPGVEITVPYKLEGKTGSCHLLVYGVTQMPEGDSLVEIMENARDMGGKNVLAHPQDGRCGFPRELITDTVKHLIDGIEAVNGGATGNMTVGELEEYIESLGLDKDLVAYIVGSDGHDPLCNGDTVGVYHFDPEKYGIEGKDLASMRTSEILKIIFDSSVEVEVRTSPHKRWWRKLKEVPLGALRQIQANGVLRAVGALIRLNYSLRTEGRELSDIIGFDFRNYF